MNRSEQSVSRVLSMPGFLAGIAVFWAWFTWACAAEWARDPDYAHGWVVVPLGIYFFWKRLSAATSGAPSCPALAWVVIFLCALTVLPIELGRQAPLYWRVFAWAVYAVTAAATLALASLRGGGGYLRAAVFPVIFVGTAVPWPTVIEQPVTLGLANAVATIVGEMLPVFGIPARIEGTVIALPACTVGIAEACSGVRSLQAALMIALAVGELMALGFWRRVLLVPIGLGLALATNLARTLALSFAGARGGEEGLSAMHDPAGWGALALLVCGILVAGRLSKGPWADDHETPSAPAGETLPQTGNAPWIAVVAIVAAGVAAGQGWYLAHEMAGRDVRGALFAVSESADIDTAPLPDHVERVLRPTSGGYVRLRRPGLPPVTGYHLVWDDSRNNSEALFHRPDVCMPGVGWKPLGVAESSPGEIGGEPVTWTVLRYEKDGVHALMLWAAWLDGEPVQFSMHSGSSVQQNALMRLIGNGRRRFSYEVAAVMLPYEGEVPPVDEAVAAEAAIFRSKEGSGK